MSEKYGICEGTCRPDVLSLDGLHRVVSWEDEVLCSLEIVSLGGSWSLG